MIFRCLDRHAEIEKSFRELPHWFQAGAAMFITFRTIDSMPREVVDRWEAEMRHWLLANGLPTELANQSDVRTQSKARLHSLPIASQAAFQKMRDRAWHHSLDECHGACLLKRRDLAEIVASALLFGDGKKYDVDRLVVMPNHVHLIAQFYNGYDLKLMSQSWLRYTARQINFETNRSGAFWQSTPFDHIIRSEEQFRYLQQYIVDNPKKANLRDQEFLYWQKE